ncbi:hypothetical protein PGTUg99_017406 [Puccinia graminis f. sp. tritici]|uniref:Uncharacterized protein n=1 Tax=Puccinia graminis f. sp. tritici TaxID=56615 RepID=A0A5B0S1R2_PUCGR|nr:hypothetical protein PGTUg99_017406 [Puccinia graminis f. sp. tritici]
MFIYHTTQEREKKKKKKKKKTENRKSPKKTTVQPKKITNPSKNTQIINPSKKGRKEKNPSPTQAPIGSPTFSFFMNKVALTQFTLNHVLSPDHRQRQCVHIALVGTKGVL